MPSYHGHKTLLIPTDHDPTMIIFQPAFHADCDHPPIDMEEHDLGI